MSTLLELKDVTIKFGGLTALKNLSFSVEQGTITSLIGPNGAGKTTAFNAITGVYQPSSGEIQILGRSVVTPLKLGEHIGSVLVALLSAVVLLICLHLQSLWEVMINLHYRYLEPFVWRNAFVSGSDYLSELSFWALLGPLIVGSVIGYAAALSLYMRGRHSPEGVLRQGVARTFQNIRLFGQMSAFQNILVGMEHRRMSGFLQALFRTPFFRHERAENYAEAFKLLEFVGLGGYANSYASALPYGLQRRLEIARALAAQPRLLLLDEPAAGMNPREAEGVMELLRALKARGISVLLIEHHMKVVMGISDKVIVLNYGNLIAQGTPEYICAHPIVVAAYLGTGASDG